jgi:putative colanic acid biosynthesis UDP-glucose lipid carrier transferase
MSTQREIYQHASVWGIVHRILDAAGIVFGIWVACLFAHQTDNPPRMLSAATAIIVYYLLSEITGAYRNWHGVSGEREVACAVGTWLVTMPAVLLLRWLRDLLGEPAPPLSPMAILHWFAITGCYIGLMRLTIRVVQRVLRSNGFNSRGFAIVGINELGFQLARNIEETPYLGLKLVGFFDDRPASRIPNIPKDVGKSLGNISELVAKARSGEIDMIYITFPMRAEERIRRVLAQLSDSTASVHIVPDFFVFELLHSRWTDIGGLPVVSVFEHPFYGVDGMLKRAMDLVMASLLLVFLAVPMACIALAIKLTSRGPVFFRQRRYGMDGKEIRVWKFRSMQACDDGAVVKQAKKNDARLTSIGGFLRKTSLDELPQLFNVIRGSMSLVGPRPHATAHNEQYRKAIQGYMLRHKVKPGITGLAQVNGWRGETDTLEKMQKRVEFDHKYIREWSLGTDVKILFMTVATVLKRDNAY